MKKILMSLLILMLVISFSTFVNAATTGKINISLSKETIKAGDEFSIEVTASDSNNLNTVEYSGLTITNQEGDISTHITVKSVEAIGDNWAKMNNEGKTDFVYSGQAIQSQKVFKVTFTASEDIKEGTYNINIEGLKVYSANIQDDTTEIGTKSVSVKAIADDTTVDAGGEDEQQPTDTKDPVDTEGTTTPSKDKSDSSSDKSTSTTNSTKKTTKLPQTGVETASIIAIVALSTVSIVSYVSYRKYKNI